MGVGKLSGPLPQGPGKRPQVALLLGGRASKEPVVELNEL